ncbi:MAG TPA: RNB domain-containing ribonuclease [Gaiellales bacterium]|nr:RNB domain-containing ribonuclease [Gaiellales bacterium]
MTRTDPPAGGGATVVCEVARRGRVLVGQPLFEPGRSITLARAGAADLQPGDLVAAVSDGRGRGAVRERLGRPDDVTALLHGLAYDAGVAEPFSEQALSEAGSPPPDGSRRVDLRGLETMTIDPERAKDHDDALSVRDGPDGPTILVHIADVSAFVPAGSALDAEASARSTSVYLPGRVDPMLPARLGDDLCSLRPHRDRLAVTLELRPDGSFTAYRSLICSDHRLTYGEVDEILSGRAADSGLAAALALMAGAAERLHADRIAAGAFETAPAELEPEIAGGRVVGARELGQGPSHRIVEELMVAANRRVAELLADAGRPALHRVHEPPQAAAAELLVRRLATLEVPTPAVPQLHGRSETAAYVAAVGRAVARHVASTGLGRAAFPPLVVRALERARYDHRSLGHSGLAARAYCHFTSPIRRYPDIVCHRALLSRLGASSDDGPAAGDLAELALDCSEAERAADRLERRGLDVCLADLVSGMLFELGPDAVFEGEVVGVIGAGAFVRFGPGCEGLLPSRDALGERCDLDELGVSLVAPRSGRRLRLGDPASVAVRSVDRISGRIRLAPAG